jgi:predicted MFS family arabinose efflux permease
LEIIGPTLNILARQTGVEFAGISNILMARGVGYIIANVAGAALQNLVKKYPEGFLSISYLIASIGLFLFLKKNFYFFK